jgi:hypothetical protein
VWSSVSSLFPRGESWLSGTRQGLTEFFGELERISRALERRARHEKLRASDLDGSLDNPVEVIGMSLLAMVAAPKDGICEVDADL